jgi:hypothetical protein
MKIKQKSNGTFSIKDLDIKHLEVIYSLLYNTVLGTEGYAGAAADLAIELERFGVQNTCEPEITITLV